MAEQPFQNVTFPSNEGTAHGYFAVPESGSGPGLIVIQEWWGLDDGLKKVVDRFAAEGFVALAPDLYGGRVAHDSDEAGQMLSSLPVAQATKDLSGGVDFLIGHDAVKSSTVGVVGYCMGGAFALLLAAQQGDRISAAVPYYGVGPGTPESYAGITAAVQGHYGTQDQIMSADEARNTEEQIRSESGAEVEFFYYDAGHAFMNPDDKMGTHKPELAEQAWSRTLEFLRSKVQ
ncbi:dienelactone hydrolase family protein [uncultured Jatrophihabitans sp.]|uniref:dienelactone hydrolase family protein n=1 Tax=uncultured Jatrophihabitans sp. TaxID=1610747 RepID=UPI0035CB0939